MTESIRECFESCINGQSCGTTVHLECTTNYSSQSSLLMAHSREIDRGFLCWYVQNSFTIDMNCGPTTVPPLLVPKEIRTCAPIGYKMEANVWYDTSFSVRPALYGSTQLRVSMRQEQNPSYQPPQLLAKRIRNKQTCFIKKRTNAAIKDETEMQYPRPFCMVREQQGIERRRTQNVPRVCQVKVGIHILWSWLRC